MFKVVVIGIFRYISGMFNLWVMMKMIGKIMISFILKNSVNLMIKEVKMMVN